MDLQLRIDGLSPAAFASRDHLLAVMKDGVTERLTIGQILDLLFDGAPEALDTWLELVAALEGDEDQIAALFALVATKVDSAAVTSALSLKQNTADLAFGQCYLDRNGSNLRLSRKSGRLLTIDGVHYPIPNAGVNLAPTSLTPGTAYYIYAFMNSGTMTLEASTTVPVENSTTGVVQKTGDASRTLVGLWLVTTGPAWSTVAVQGASYFNPVDKTSSGAVATTTTTTSTSLAELSTNARLQFVTFGDRPARAEIMGRTGVSVASAETLVTVAIGGSGILPNAIVNRLASTSGSHLNSFYGGNSQLNSAGLYTASILAAVTTGTGSFFDTQVVVTISG